MSYLSIPNLYKSQDILALREAYALEKVHGTSAHLSWRATDAEPLRFFSGGESHVRFVGLFDKEKLTGAFGALNRAEITVYGEAYGGAQQGMKHVYGAELRFIAFDVQIDGMWLTVPDAEDIVVNALGLEFVPYVKVSTDLAALDAERDKPSEVAKRRGTGDDKPREGVVLRPLIELTKNNGARVIAKHKSASFEERATPPKVVDAAKLQTLADAQAIAQEWVTAMRLEHVLPKVAVALGIETALLGIEHTGHVIKAMQADVEREAAGEIVPSKDALSAIGKRTAQLYKERLQSALKSG